MDFFFETLGKLSPVLALLILFLGAAVYYLRKDLNAALKKIDDTHKMYQDRIDAKENSHNEQLERISKEHREEIRERNEKMEAMNDKNTEAQTKIAFALETIKDNLKND